MKQRHPIHRLSTAFCAAALYALGGCATYHPLPLDEKPALHRSVNELRHESNLHTPLTLHDIELLAVENNPDLLAARAQAGVAQAQVLQAGILPNPSFNPAYSFLSSGPGTRNGWTAGLSQDIKSLITLSEKKAEARASARQVDASLLWQEWQVIGKARLLAIDLIEGEKLRSVLAQAQARLKERYDASLQATREGNADLSTVSPDLVALGDMRKQTDDLMQLLQARRHAFNALLGLTPDATVPLAGNLALPSIDAAAVDKMLPDMACRRPDLIALQFGYQAQDEKLRQAILAQFPALNIGLTGGSDTSGVHTIGPQITIDLPIFDRNQGNIAIERATRHQLHDEYEARLGAATGEVEAMLADANLLQRQLVAQHAELAETETIARQAEEAFRAGNLTERAYVDFVVARFSKQQALLTLEQSLLEQQVALATLIGVGMPSVTTPNVDGAAS